MRDLYIISGGFEAPHLLAVKDRMGAAQAFEAHSIAKSKRYSLVDLKGNAAFRCFVEGSQNNIKWGDYRLDLLTESI